MRGDRVLASTVVVDGLEVVARQISNLHTNAPGAGAQLAHLSVPAGTAAGDVVEAQVSVAANAAIGAPAGGTAINTTDQGTTLRQAVSGGRGVGAGQLQLVHLQHRGHPRHGLLHRGQHHGAGQRLLGGVGLGHGDIAPSLTTTTSGTKVVGGAAAATSTTPPSGMTERYDVSTSALLGGG
ncbi:MAG: hypothetical protein LC792_05540 [Actinobacteria bacterium]|nr:hypothetical protein [Actinomycetota bacterium]